MSEMMAGGFLLKQAVQLVFICSLPIIITACDFCGVDTRITTEEHYVYRIENVSSNLTLTDENGQTYTLEIDQVKDDFFYFKYIDDPMRDGFMHGFRIETDEIITTLGYYYDSDTQSDHADVTVEPSSSNCENSSESPTESSTELCSSSYSIDSSFSTDREPISTVTIQGTLDLETKLTFIPEHSECSNE